ncbi:MFS transporter [Micromonospora sp. WMMD558]|uniref:MFS transporter n=1 Tax=Micromonospora sp. WMMD558 TaxID=3403462 RepID=UPI003BF55EE3
MTTHIAPGPGAGRTIAVIAGATLAFAAAQTAVVPSLGAMARTLGASAVDVTWTLSAHLIAAAIFTPLMGRLGDMFGKRRLLTLALLCFTVGAVVSAAGPDLPSVVAGRIIQGVGGGVFPLGFAILRDELPPRRVAGSIGLLAALSGLGAGLGLVIGGVLTDHAPYRWIFWLGAGAGTLSTVAVRFLLPRSRVAGGGRVDVLGAAVLGLGLAAPLVAIGQGNRWGWGDARTVGLLAVGALTLASWVRIERRTADPLVHIPTLARPTVLLTNVATVFIALGMFGAFVLLPQLAQAPPATGYGLGVTATGAGLLLLPGSLVMLLTGPLAGALSRRYGAKGALILGALVTAAGLFALARDFDSRAALLGYSLIVFAGIGLAQAAMPNLVIEAVPADRTGQATGVNTLVRSVGSSLGAQVAATITAASAVSGGLPAASGYARAFLVAGLASLAAVLVGVLIPGGPGNRHRAAEAPVVDAPAGLPSRDGPR